MSNVDHAGPAARRYAKALFAAALDADAMGGVSSDMDLIGEVLRDEQAAAALADPRIDHERKLQMLTAAFGKGLHELTRSLLGVLAHRKRLTVLPEVPTAFGALLDDHEGRLRGTLECAREIDAESWAALERALSGATGKSVSLEAHIDENLLGGVRVTLAGTRYDGSARGRLEILRQRLQDVELG